MSRTHNKLHHGDCQGDVGDPGEPGNKGQKGEAGTPGAPGLQVSFSSFCHLGLLL